MNKDFFKRPLYYTAGKISKIMRDFQNHQNNKLIKAGNKAWNKLFKENEFIEFNLASGVKINLYKDSVLSRSIYKGFEKEETDYLTSILREGDIFIDIGANIGLFSLMASKAVGSKGLVISFEPTPNTFSRLSENVKLNDFKNINVRNIGLSDTTDELTFYISKNGYDAWNSFAPSQDNKLEIAIKVPVSTLDFELIDIEKSKIKLVKIDVEGWEKFVLNGGKDFLVNFNPIVMIEFTEENTFNAGYPVHDIYRIMQDFGYKWYRLNDGKLIPEVQKMRYPYDNLIAMK